MGDLQCAARVFVARHGEALYENELLSDAGGWLSPLGREQARTLAEVRRNASDEITRFEPSAFENPGQQRGGGRLPVGTCYDQVVATPKEEFFEDLG